MAGPGTLEKITRFISEAAAQAPSVHNTQPWWFSGDGPEISVHADVERRLGVADPDGRELMISCGAALFTVRLALRHLGYVPEVAVLPDPDRPGLVARVGWREQIPPAEYEQELFAQVACRRTHRGGFEPSALPIALIAALRQDASSEGAILQVAADDWRRAALGATVEAAEHVLRLDAARAQEQARWAPPPGSPRRDGVPPTAYPARPVRTDPPFPGRDFARGHGWGLAPHGPEPLLKSAGVVCLLVTEADHKPDWIGAGQALQRIMLRAATCGAAVALHSQPLEIPELREFVRVHLSNGAYPQLLLRIGTASQRTTSVRRPVDEVLH